MGDFNTQLPENITDVTGPGVYAKNKQFPTATLDRQTAIIDFALQFDLYATNTFKFQDQYEFTRQHQNESNGPATQIDFSFVSTALASDSKMLNRSRFFHSDHFPLVTTLNSNETALRYYESEAVIRSN